MNEWKYPNRQCCASWLVLPTVYSDALSYGEQLDKFCFALNQVIENNNFLPTFVQQLIQEYISSGAIGEVVQDIIGQFILNVKYPPEGITPAVGDGSADDTAAIQGCIDYAAEHNGMAVYFPSGSYLTGSVTLKSGVSLFGFDRYSTKLVLKGGATQSLLYGNNVNNISIINLTLDGNSGIQVNDVNVVSAMAKDMIFNNLIVKDGHNLIIYNGLGGHLQVSNVVFGNTVQKCFSISGNVDAVVDNVIFNHLSSVGGVNVMEISADGGIYTNVISKATCTNAIVVTGNNNKIVARVVNATNPITDDGNANNIEIVGISKKTYVENDVIADLKNIRYNIRGGINLTVDGDTVTNFNGVEHNIAGNVKNTIGGNVKTTIEGDTVNNYNNVKNTIDGNVETTIEGNTVNSYNNIKNTIGGNVETTIEGNTVNSYKNIKNTIGENVESEIKGDVTYNFNNGNINFKNAIIKGNISTDKIYNAISFGFKNDGSTDNTQIFNDFINTYDNCVLYFPSGKYVINGFITINKNIHIIGDKATFLPGMSKGGRDVTALLTFNYDAILCGVTIDGSNIPQNKWDETELTNLHLITGVLFNKNAFMWDCSFTNFWGEGAFLCGELSYLSNCYFNVGGKWPVNDGNDSFGDAIYVRNNSKNVKIENCVLDMVYNGTTNSRAGIVVEFVDNVVHITITNTKITHANRGIHVEETNSTYLGIYNSLFEACDAQIFNWNNDETTMLLVENTSFSPTGNDYNGQYGINKCVCELNNCIINRGNTFFRDLLHSSANNCEIYVGEREIVNSEITFNECLLDFNNVYDYFNYGSTVAIYNCKLDSNDVKYVNGGNILKIYNSIINRVIFQSAVGFNSELHVIEGDNYNFSNGSSTFKLFVGDKYYPPNLLGMPYDFTYTPYDIITIDISNGAEHNFKNMLHVNKDSVYVCIVLGGEVQAIGGRGTRGGYYFKVTTDNNENITGSDAKLDVRGAYFDLTVNGTEFTVKKGEYSNFANILLLPYHYLYDSGLI